MRSFAEWMRRLESLENRLAPRQELGIWFLRADYSSEREWENRHTAFLENGGEDPGPPPRPELTRDANGNFICDIDGSAVSEERMAKAKGRLIIFVPSPQESEAMEAEMIASGQIEIGGHDCVTGEYGLLGQDGRLLNRAREGDFSPS